MGKIVQSDLADTLAFYPWEQGHKPYFVNPENGLKWYADKFTTQYATQDVALYGGQSRKGLKNVVAFYVKDEKSYSCVLINDKQEILATGETSIALCFQIDKLKIWEDFAQHEDREDMKERRNYIKQITDFVDDDIEPVKFQSNPTENRIY